MTPKARSRRPVAVVLPSRDRPEMLARAVGALRDALGPDDELVVVDSASVDAARVAEVAAAQGARLVRCDAPGVNRARNAGWGATSSDLVLFTDDDVVVDAGWADAYAAAAEEHPQVDFFTGWIGAPDGQDDRWQVALKQDEAPVRLTSESRGTLGHGASLAVRRSMLATIGGWDETMGAGALFGSAPETDLFDRIFAAGGSGLYVPSARGWHDQWRGRGQVVRLNFRYGMGTGARVAKLVRTDRRRAARVAGMSLWSWGLVSIGQRVRHVDKSGFAIDVARLAGYLVGFSRAIVCPVRHGHFRPRFR